MNDPVANLLQSPTPANPSKSAGPAMSASQTLLNIVHGVTSYVGDYANALGGDIEGGIDTAVSGAEGGAAEIGKGGVANDAKGAAQAGLGATAGAVGAIFSPVTALFQATGKQLQGLGQEAANSPAVQQFAMAHGNALDAVTKAQAAFETMKAAHPELATDIGNAATTALGALGGKAADSEGSLGDMASKEGDRAGAAGKVAGKIGAATKDIAGDLVGKVKSAYKAAQDAKFDKATNVVKEPIKAAEKAASEAWDIVKPMPTTKVVEDYRASGNIKAATGAKSWFKGEDITPNNQDKAVIDALTPMVESGEITSKMSPSDQIKTIAQKVSQQNQNVKGFVADHNAPIAMTDIDSALEKVKEGSAKVFGDASSAYDDVIAKAKSFLKTGQKVIDADTGSESIDKENGDAALPKDTHTDSQSVMSARQAFDKWADKAVSGAFKRDASGMLTDTDNARVMAVRDIRSAFNNAVADSMPTNSPYKPMLKSESGLMRAAENINNDAGGLQKGKIGEILSKHPYVRRALFDIVGLGIAGSVASEVEKHL